MKVGDSENWVWVKEAEKRAHSFKVIVAFDHLDEVISLLEVQAIRRPQKCLIERFELSGKLQQEYPRYEIGSDYWNGARVRLSKKFKEIFGIDRRVERKS